MSQTDLDRAQEHVTYDAIRETLMAMVDIPSPTGGEGEMARFILERLRGAGIEAYPQLVDEGRPNAVGRLPGVGDGYSLLLTGHMDTSYAGDEEDLVGEGFKPVAVERDGWIWGLGANNMKSGLAAALVALEAVVKSKTRLRGDILYAGVVGEIEKAPIEEFQGISFSGYGAGSKHLVTHGVTADFALLAEPTGMRICSANMGCIWFRVTVPGTVSHSAFSNRPGIVNAIEVMGDLQRDIKAWAKDYEAQNEYAGEHPNVTLGAIRGGVPWRLSRNPYNCSLYFEARTVPGQSAEAVKRQVRSVLRAFAERTGTPEPEMLVYVTDPPLLLDDSLPVIASLCEAQKRICGGVRRLPIRRPGADAIHFSSYGVPCVQFGPGMARTHPDAKGRLIHELGEHVFTEDVLAASKIYLATILDICNRPAKDDI